VTYTLRDGPSGELTIQHAGEELRLTTKAESTRRINARRASLPEPQQPKGRAPMRRLR